MSLAQPSPVSINITSENVFGVDVSKLALDSRFGSLVFQKVEKLLKEIQAWLKEMRDLGYTDILRERDRNIVTDYIKKFAEQMNWLAHFDISTVTNAKQEHDNFETRIATFHDQIFDQVVMRFLSFLREERRRQNPDERKLDEEVRKVTQMRADLEKELKTVREDIERIKDKKPEVAVAKGERAAVQLAVYFDEEAEKYQVAASKWFYWLAWAYVAIVIIILGFAIWYLFGKPSLIWQAGVAKLILVAALWYGLAFASRNYNINSNLAAVNRHRAAVARTLEDFIAHEQQKEKPRLSEMMQEAAQAMFKQAPIGFISKAEKDTSSPIYKVVGDVIGMRNTQ